MITVPDEHVLKTLHDAGHYATALPKGVQERAEWQTAAEMLILAAQGQRPVTFADIAMRRALHAHTPERGTNCAEPVSLQSGIIERFGKPPPSS